MASPASDQQPFPSSSGRQNGPVEEHDNTLSQRRHLSLKPEILAPTPRRHLLESSESQHWLHTPPLSPSSSRGVSPVSHFNSGSLQRRFRTNSYFATRPSSASLHSLFDSDKLSEPRVSNVDGLKHQTAGRVEDEASMGRMLIKWMHKHNMRDWVLPTIIAAGTLLKWCIGLGSYSGEGTPPMFGDYEAQRHWMELTIHLPISQWYTYDLEYWGLDYPPLTAYHSWLCGIIGSWFNPSWFALDKSRGIETPESKTYMRSTVVAFDLLIYVPALVMFVRTWQASRSRRTQHLSLLTLLFQPALLLIDFGHFQYNSIMLGLTLFAINFFAQGHDLLGAFCFVMSLGFKQMSLYYAPAIGSYLLSKCLYLVPKAGSRLFVRLAAVTSLSFLLLFLPFLPPFSPFSGIVQPIKRIFPFARGLFEDKVANFWCASNVVFKWKRWANSGILVKLSTVLTLFAFLPSVFILIRTALKTRSASEESRRQSDSNASQAKATHTHTPMLPLLPYALLTSSMSFFLFSFQVHEKTILLPLMPVTLLLCGAPTGSAMFGWGVLINNVAVFSMWPLLKRDGLGLQYVVMTLLWNRLIGYNLWSLPRKSFIQLLSLAVYAAAITLHLAEFVIAPPSRYPDLFPVLNVLISMPVFALAWLWSIKSGIEVGWALGGLGTTRRSSTTSSAAQGNESFRKTESEGSKVAPSLDAGRRLGMRTVSLGYAAGRRRAPTSSSVSSVGRPRTAGSGT